LHTQEERTQNLIKGGGGREKAVSGKKRSATENERGFVVNYVYRGAARPNGGDQELEKTREMGMKEKN